MSPPPIEATRCQPKCQRQHGDGGQQPQVGVYHEEDREDGEGDQRPEVEGVVHARLGAYVVDQRSRAVSHWRLDNAFQAGDRAVPGGTFDGSTDMIGISLDADLDSE